MATKLFRPVTDREMHCEGDTTHSSIIIKSGWEVFVGRIKDGTQGGTQGALFMRYTVLS